MGISLEGDQGLSVRSVRAVFVVFTIFFGFLIYFYGPPFTPAVRSAANEQCNEYANGNYRDYRLEWVSGPGEVTPHWSCGDASRPDVAPVSLGWWVSPFR